MPPAPDPWTRRRRSGRGVTLSRPLVSPAVPELPELVRRHRRRAIEKYRGAKSGSSPLTAVLPRGNTDRQAWQHLGERGAAASGA
jgi:hypothetical protein